MWFHVDPASGLPIYIQIINQVKRASATGLLKTGEQMPSVRELAVELAVNPNTISKAYQELEREGIIKTVRGVGTFVSELEVTILHEERIRTFAAAIDKVLIEAHHLGLSYDEICRVFDEQLNEWKVRQK